MCPTPLGRVHTRVSSMVLPALLGTLVSLIDGRPDWIVLVGVLLLLGTALDSAVYSWLIRWQPPWMTGVLALFELGLLVVLANILELNLTIAESVVFYFACWLLVVFTRIVVLPTISLTYIESAGELRRIEWSIAPGGESLPILASAEEAAIGPGRLLREASGVHAVPLEPLPSPSGTFDLPAEMREGDRVEIGGAVLTVEVAAARTRLRESGPPAAPPTTRPPVATSRPFSPSKEASGRRRRSAATRSGATVASYATILATACAVVSYLAGR